MGGGGMPVDSGRSLSNENQDQLVHLFRMIEASNFSKWKPKGSKKPNVDKEAALQSAVVQADLSLH